MQSAYPLERRRLARFPGTGMSVQLRLRNRLQRSTVEVLDFNRHGIAVRTEQPLNRDQLLYLSIDAGRHALERVIGVVHNCVPQADGYRCGIRFRTRSVLQFDAEQVEFQLACMEDELAQQRGEPQRPLAES